MNNLLRLIGRRLVALPIMALGVTVLVFFLMSFSKTDPAYTALGDGASPEAVAEYHEKYGLDDPWPVRYVRYMGDLIHGDMGTYGAARNSVAKRISTALPVTMQLTFIGLAIGAQTAAEIALSILAQIVSIKNARPQTEGFSSALLEAMAQTDAAGQQAALAVIAARHGSTPREIGAKMLVRTDGSIVGSVGGGIMEHRTILAAQEMLTGAAPAYQRLHFSADGKNDDAAIAACGGSMEIVLTRLQPGEEIK